MKFRKVKPTAFTYNVLIAAHGGVVNTAALAAVKATQVRTAPQCVIIYEVIM
jgi:hypothetical protein